MHVIPEALDLMRGVAMLALRAMLANAMSGTSTEQKRIYLTDKFLSWPGALLLIVIGLLILRANWVEERNKGKRSMVKIVIAAIFIFFGLLILLFWLT